MPDLSSAMTTIRKDGHRCIYYGTTPSEASVLEGTISSLPAEPTLSFSYTNISGSHTATAADMEMEFFRAGVTLGRARLYSASAGTIQIEEVSQGRLDLLLGDTFKVYRSWRLHGKLIAANAAFDKDSRLTYLNQTIQYRPVVVVGGGRAGLVNPATNLLTVQLDASKSYTLTGSGKSYLWDVQDGTITVGTATSAAITVTFPLGKRWIDITVTDTGNSQSTTMHLPINAHSPADGAYVPFELQRVTINGSIDNAHDASFGILGGATLVQLPIGSYFMIFSVDIYDGVEQAFGSEFVGASHMRFTGYLNTDQDDINATDWMTNEFTAISPMQKLANLMGFAQALENATTPVNWQEAANLSTTILLDYLIRWHTTLMNLHDFINRLPAQRYPIFYVQQTSPGAQLRELVASLKGNVTGHKNGGVVLRKPLSKQADSVRNVAVTAMTATADDIEELTRATNHSYSVGWLKMKATVASPDIAGATAFEAWSPGTAPAADAPDITEFDKVISDSIPAGLAECGWEFAYRNNLYNGLPTYQDISCRMLDGSYDVFDVCYEEWFRLDIAATYSGRGRSLTNLRFEIIGYTVSYDEDTNDSVVTLKLHEETKGASGIFKVPDKEENNGLPPFEDPIYVPPVIAPPANDNFGPVGPLWAMDSSSPPIIVYSDDAGATYTQNVHSGLTGNGIWGCSDPWKKKRKFILTTDGLFKTEDIRTPTGSFVQVATPLQLLGNASYVAHTIFMSPNYAGLLFALSGASGYSVTADYGLNFYQNGLDGTAGTFATSLTAPWNFNRGFAAISPRSGGAFGGVLVSQVRVGSNLNYYVNTGKGLAGSTWNLGGQKGDPFPRNGGIVIPLNRDDGSVNWPDAAMEFYASGSVGSGSADFGVVRSVDRGATVPTSLPAVVGFDPIVGGSPMNINDRYVFAPRQKGNNIDWYRYDRTAAAWTIVSSTTLVNRSNLDSSAQGWPYNDLFLLHFCRDVSATPGVNGGLNISLDGGASWSDITPSQFGAAPSVAYAEGDIGVTDP